MPDPGYSGSLGAIPGGSRPSRIQTPEGSLMRSLIPYHPPEKTFQNLKKTLGHILLILSALQKEPKKTQIFFLSALA
jgi:hypothetical protein